MLAFRGTWIQLGAAPAPLKIPGTGLIFKNAVVTGSLIGSPSEIEDMLQFAAEKNVRPLIETAPFAEVNQAIEKVIANQARYRIVLIVDPAFN